MCKRRGILLSQGKCHLNLKMDDLGGAESSISPPKWQICLPEREPVVHLAGKGIFSKEKEKGASALIWPGRPSFGAMGGSAENSASYALGVAFKAIPSPELLARLEHQDFFWENLLVKAT